MLISRWNCSKGFDMYVSVGGEEKKQQTYKQFCLVCTTSWWCVVVAVDLADTTAPIKRASPEEVEQIIMSLSCTVISPLLFFFHYSAFISSHFKF